MMRTQKIIIAPNAFKHSLTATETAESILEGLNLSKLNFKAQCFPVGDGGDGTAELLINKMGAKIYKNTVNDPQNQLIEAEWGFVEQSKEAIIGLASASGIKLLSGRKLLPLEASTFGTGQLIKAALDVGAQHVILCVGGSATIDAGTGILRALGVVFLDNEDNELKRISEFTKLERIETKNLDNRLQSCKITILCDVENPLIGLNGTAHIFGPQKGADQKDIIILEEALQQFAEISVKKNGKKLHSLKFGGAAGGVAAGLHAFLNAELKNGIDYFLNLTDFASALKQADLIITGEGSLDNQTLQGKAPMGVANFANYLNIPVIAMAGCVPFNVKHELYDHFTAIIAIGNEPQDLELAIASTNQNIVRVSKQLGNMLAVFAD